ncbi:MAG: flagellar hook-basal body complex protein FliE [Planctomycetota bacterium]
MISNSQNHLLSQMKALESMSRNQPPPVEINAESSQSFGTLMQQAINQVNDTQMQAGNMSKAFEMGEQIDVSEMMIAIQKSRVSFQALTEVRNKLLTAYQDVMNMPV